MTQKNLSTTPPTLSNPLGTSINVAISIVFVILTIVVVMRLWGRYRYRTPGQHRKAQFGEPRFWIMLSDLTIVLSYLTALVLTVVLYVDVHWGEGLHSSQLSPTQLRVVLEMFYIYQVLYKFASGIAKIATLLLLLAISTSQMRAFNMFCKCFAAYIAAYCIATSIATVFQCGLDIDSNWIMTNDQSHCFYKPPFWYTHAAINISATAVMAFLPWWLFTFITYKRKHAIATILSMLALAETALGSVRLLGLYRSAHSKSDLSYGTVTGLLVSQLEVDFACIAACVPTVLKMSEEFWVIFCVRILGRTMSWSGSESMSKTGGQASTGAGGHIHLSDLRSVDHAPKPRGPYASFDKEDEGSMDSQEHIVKKGASVASASGGIKVETDYYVRVEEPRAVSFYDDRRENNRDGSAQPTYETTVVVSK